MRLKNKKSSGFTLIEVLIASAIAAVIGAVIVVAFISGQNSFVMGTNLLEIHVDARVAMEWIVRDVQWANDGVITYIGGANVLVLSIPSIDAANDIKDMYFDSVVYTLNGTNLMRLVEPDAVSSRIPASDTIANNITNLQFTALAKNVAVSLTAQKTVLGGRVISETLNDSIKMRNF